MSLSNSKDFDELVRVAGPDNLSLVYKAIAETAETPAGLFKQKVKSFEDIKKKIVQLKAATVNS
jgi:hypothetical protein